MTGIAYSLANPPAMNAMPGKIYFVNAELPEFAGISADGAEDLFAATCTSGTSWIFSSEAAFSSVVLFSLEVLVVVRCFTQSHICIAPKLLR